MGVVNMPVYKGFQAQIYKDGVRLGYVKEVTLEIDHSLETYVEINSQYVSRLQEGPISITGRLTRAWVDVNYLALVGQDTLSEFDLSFVVNSQFTLYVYDCKFSKGSVNVPSDGFLMEDYDFMAKDFGVVG